MACFLPGKFPQDRIQVLSHLQTLPWPTTFPASFPPLWEHLVRAWVIITTTDFYGCLPSCRRAPFYSYNLASWLEHSILNKCLLNEQIHSYSIIFNSYLLLYVLHSMIQKIYLNEDQGQPWRRNSHKIKGWLCMRLCFFKYFSWKVYLIPSCLNRVGLTQIHISLKILLPIHNNCLFWKTDYLLSNSQKIF